MKYPIAERFKAPQGEGLYTGTPMAFIRLVGCSVGKGVCEHCDTDFDKIYPNLDGGKYDPQELLEWAGDYQHICVTGGEPLDRDLRELITSFLDSGRVAMVHIETSGTVFPAWLGALQDRYIERIWITVSPKPNYLDAMLGVADEIKVIVGGLGNGPGWPTITQARAWAKAGKLVYIQPRNNKFTTDSVKMAEVVDIVTKFPELRLSAQFHKYLRTR